MYAGRHSVRTPAVSVVTVSFPAPFLRTDCPLPITNMQELLSQSGTILGEDGFWIDKLRSFCVVTFETQAQVLFAPTSPLMPLAPPVGAAPHGLRLRA